MLDSAVIWPVVSSIILLSLGLLTVSECMIDCSVNGGVSEAPDWSELSTGREESASETMLETDLLAPLACASKGLSSFPG